MMTRRRSCQPARSSTSSAGTTTSANNRHNSDPKNWVGYGDRTIDEMGFSWIGWIDLTQEEYEKELRPGRPSARPDPRSSNSSNRGRSQVGLT